MSETTDEEQAAMAIKLTDNVRDLIRSEIKAALEDRAFLARLHSTDLAHMLTAYVIQHANAVNILAPLIDQRVENIVTRMRMQEIEQRRLYTGTTSGLTY
jgi:hypothetical protein